MAIIGIVLVSHSKKIAEGVYKLARQMGETDLKMRAVGGVGEASESLGTDADAIRAAIEQVYSDDGVLVLMDLGSAVMNAELALEMLPPQKAKKVFLCDAPFVEGAVAAAVQARIGANIQQVIAEARFGLAAKQVQLGNSPLDEVDSQPDNSEIAKREGYAIKIIINHPVGLHARPAARFVETAGRFLNTDIKVKNLTANQGPVNAKSIISLTSLGVCQGDEILITASGEEAQDALNALQVLVDNHFDEKI